MLFQGNGSLFGSEIFITLNSLSGSDHPAINGRFE